jgi:hypothetical protein
MRHLSAHLPGCTVVCGLVLLLAGCDEPCCVGDAECDVGLACFEGRCARLCDDAALCDEGEVCAEVGVCRSAAVQSAHCPVTSSEEP